MFPSGLNFSKYILLIYMALLSSSALAQKGFHFGLKYQPNICSVQNQNFTDSVNIDLKSTFAQGGGVTFAFNLFDNFGIQAEALYSEQGQKFIRTDTSGNNYENILKLTYINVPVLLRLNSSTRKTVSFNITGGIQMGLLYGAGLTVKRTEGTITTGVASKFETVDMAVVYGGGFDINLAEFFHFNIGLRLVEGLTDIGRSGNELFHASPTYNKITSVYAGVTF
jgi:hypothetical protein